MTTYHQQTGVSGEELACEWLQNKGLRLVMRNFSSRWGEIDLIMREAQTLVFVEVKVRRSQRYGSALEAVNLRKQRKLWQTAESYLLKHPHAGPVRFDVVGIQVNAAQNEILHVENAFEI